MDKRSHFGNKPRWKPKTETKVFSLTIDELKKIKGTHGFGSWKLACTGCGRQFTEADIGGTIVSVPRKKPRHAPKFYYHLKCFNSKEGMNDAKKERKQVCPRAQLIV